MIRLSLPGDRYCLRAVLAIVATTVLLGACHDHYRWSYRQTGTTYSVAGTIAGLGDATGLVLQNNGGDDLAIPANSTSFQFPIPLAANTAYNVTVAAQPTGLTCTVSHGAGPHITGPVADISIACNAGTHTIAGNIVGLGVDGLVLRNNGGDDLAVSANADTFQFATPVAASGGYNVTVLTQPTGLTCSVNNGAGTHVSADVSNVQVTCSTSTFSIGGSITGLTGSGLVLQNNGADDLSVAADATSFEFATAVAYGATSVVTIESQPAGQGCSVSNGAATVDSNITNVIVACTTIVTHTLSVSAGANGAVAPHGAISVNHGADQSFTATPDPGWAVDQWLVGGVPVQFGGSVYALANVTADFTVQVTFARATLVSSTASLALAAAGISRQIAITNTGSVTATNVMVTYPTWPVGTVASTNCGSTLTAGSSCTITIAPGAVATSNCGTGSAPTSDVIDVVADNASTTSVGVQVLTYGCMYQSGFLATIDDTTPATSSIGGSIAAAVEFAMPLEWGGGGTMVGSSSTTDGAANTTTISSVLAGNGGVPYAAQGCYDLTDGGYADWYLPAVDELMDLYLNLSPVAAAGISASSFYWSSTEQAPILAKAVGPGGASYDASKFMAFNVRCVRRAD